MRGRGLKHDKGSYCGRTLFVAPHAVAWIETLKDAHTLMTHDVAPHAGAWIETEALLSYLSCIESPPMRGRGLKPCSTAS